jgi:hypothetical protein
MMPTHLDGTPRLRATLPPPYLPETGERAVLWVLGIDDECYGYEIVWGGIDGTGLSTMALVDTTDFLVPTAKDATGCPRVAIVKTAP